MFQSACFLSTVLAYTGGNIQPDSAEVKRIDALIARLIDAKVSWESRCAAEDDLAKERPEAIMPRLLKHAAKPMPSGGIYNSAGRASDKSAPVEWQIWYAVGRAWSEQANRLPSKTGGEILVELLAACANDAEKYLVVQQLYHRWSPKAEEPVSKVMLDRDAGVHLRISAAYSLVTRGKQAYHEEMLKIFDRASHEDKIRWIEVLVSQRNKTKTGIDPRVVVRGFALLAHEESLYKKEVVKRPDAHHGGYFATNWLSDYVGEKFQPNADDPRYNNEGRRDPRWFADTVANALGWWEKNKEKYK